MQISGKTAANVIQPSEISSLVFLGECTRRVVGSYGSGLSIVVINSLAQTILASQWVESLHYPWLGSIVIVTVLGGVIPSVSNEARKLGQTLWDRVETKIEGKYGGLWNKIPWKEKKPKVAAKLESNRSTASSSRAETQPKYVYMPRDNTYNYRKNVFYDAHHPFRSSRDKPFQIYPYSGYTRTGNVKSSSETVVNEYESDDDGVVIKDVVDQSTVFSDPVLRLKVQE